MVAAFPNHDRGMVPVIDNQVAERGGANFPRRADGVGFTIHARLLHHEAQAVATFDLGRTAGTMAPANPIRAGLLHQIQRVKMQPVRLRIAQVPGHSSTGFCPQPCSCKCFPFRKKPALASQCAVRMPKGISCASTTAPPTRTEQMARYKYGKSGCHRTGFGTVKVSFVLAEAPAAIGELCVWRATDLPSRSTSSTLVSMVCSEARPFSTGTSTPTVADFSETSCE